MKALLTNYERMVFDRLNRDWSAQIESKKVTISYENLRLESANLGTQQNIPFAMLSDDNSVPAQPSEIRLNKSDIFVATRIGFFIAKVASGGTRATTRLRTYPNQRIFTGASEAVNFEALYQAGLNIMIDQTNYYPEFYTGNFLNVPPMQEQMATVTATPAGYTAAGVDRDIFNIDDSTVEMNPNVSFSGNQKITTVIQLPESVALAGSGGTTNFCCLIFGGFLIQSGAIK